MKLLATPRGTLKIQKVFDTVEEAKLEGYGEYFMYEGTHILVKHIGEHSCLFAQALKCS